jgi:hypothetical protein
VGPCDPCSGVRGPFGGHAVVLVACSHRASIVSRCCYGDIALSIAGGMNGSATSDVVINDVERACRYRMERGGNCNCCAVSRKAIQSTWRSAQAYLRTHGLAAGRQTFGR